MGHKAGHPQGYCEYEGVTSRCDNPVWPTYLYCREHVQQMCHHVWAVQTYEDFLQQEGGLDFRVVDAYCTICLLFVRVKTALLNV